MLTIAMIVGLWTTTCIQTQIGSNQAGWVRESFEISENGSFQFKRNWFRDAQCSEYVNEDVENGTIEIGAKIRTIFMPGSVYEANFKTSEGTDLGAITKQDKYLQIARGVKNSGFRNTMLSLFKYSQQNPIQ